MSELLDSLARGVDALADRPDVAERVAALASVRTHGLPSARSEKWRYTSLRALSARAFRPSGADDRVDVDPALLKDVPAPRLVFVNGQFDAGLSDASGLPTGVRFARVDVVAESGGTVAGSGGDLAFEGLNSALATEGITLVVDAGVRVDAPLNVVFIGAPSAGDIAVHARHAVSLGAGARACLVEHHLHAGEHAHLSNHALLATLDEQAELQHVRVQDEAGGAHVFAQSAAVLMAQANYRRVDLELGAGLSRHEFAVFLNGDGARLDSGGVLAASRRRHLDTRISITHFARDTSCDLVWRGAAAGRSRAAFHGGIVIQAGADGSAAALSNKNLLLSENAEIDTQPVLEIHADEVTASHGATVGRLDPTQLFYLRTRGIGEEQARSILTAAFGRAALAPLGDSPLVEPLAERLRERLSSLDAS